MTLIVMRKKIINNQQIVLKALNESLEATKSLNMTKFVPELEAKIKVIEAGDMIAVERELAVIRSKSVTFGNHGHVVPTKVTRPQSIRRNHHKLRGFVDSHLSIFGGGVMLRSNRFLMNSSKCWMTLLPTA